MWLNIQLLTYTRYRRLVNVMCRKCSIVDLAQLLNGNLRTFTYKTFVLFLPYSAVLSIILLLLVFT